MACCCKSPKGKVASSCLGRCELPKHRCLDKEDVKPGPVPKYMGWLWDAKDSPEHQLRCGWRPGHISCPVLKTIEMHNSCSRGGCCSAKPCRFSCGSCCGPPKPCCKTDCGPPNCALPCLTSPSCTKPPCQPQCTIRIIRHGGNYTISTKPSNISNSPTGPFPLKYVLNVDPLDPPPPNAKYSIEAKFNDYHFDYTTSQTSFVLDFAPPEQKCSKPCPKKYISCLDPCPRPC